MIYTFTDSLKRTAEISKSITQKRRKSENSDILKIMEMFTQNEAKMMEKQLEADDRRHAQDRESEREAELWWRQFDLDREEQIRREDKKFQLQLMQMQNQMMAQRRAFMQPHTIPPQSAANYFQSNTSYSVLEGQPGSSHTGSLFSSRDSGSLFSSEPTPQDSPKISNDKQYHNL